MAVNINGFGVGTPKANTTQAPKNEQNATANTASSAQSDDAVTLSNQAQALTTLKAKIDAAPDVDQAKVDAIRAQLAQGQFEVDSQSIAERMLGMK